MLSNMRLFRVWPVCFCLLLVGCMKEDTETVLLPIPAREVVGIPLPEGFDNHFQVNEGPNPPDIAGLFLATPMKLDYASDGYYNPRFYDLTFGFSHLYGRNTTDYGESQGGSVGSAIPAQVIGNGNKFTVYFISNMKDDEEMWSCKTATLISGTLESDGISDFQYANVMIEKKDPFGKIMDAGQYHVFHDDDNFVSVIGE